MILQPGIGRAHGSCSILFRTTSACHPKSVPLCCHPHADANARPYRTGCWRCASHPAASTACWPPAGEPAGIQSVGSWFGGWHGKGLLSRAGAASGQRAPHMSPVGPSVRWRTTEHAGRCDAPVGQQSAQDAFRLVGFVKGSLCITGEGCCWIALV